ncbi:MAG: glycosyltransferase family 9 protein [Epsilonproteobacteria bacterium]|nr:glycosyltransferase family 9 protein [Campylobacterota bacterium]
MSIPLHSKLRRIVKDSTDSFLKFFSKKASGEKIPKESIENILVVRINYRIGNMLFTTPLLKQLQNEFTNAKIDVMVGAPFTKVLFQGFSNIENVYDFPRDLLKYPLQMLRYVNQLRKKRYDVVIAPNFGSTSDRIATFLARADHKVSFCVGDRYSPVDRCIERQDTHINHEALKPLELLKIFDITPDYNLKLTVELQEDELSKGKKLVENFKNGAKIFGIFRNARYDKKIDDVWWQELISAMQNKAPDIVFIDILSPDVKERLPNITHSFEEKNLRTLAAFMANLDAFICGDTGPMHLASASGVPTIALFKTTAPTLYGTLKEKDHSIEMDGKSVNQVADEILAHS